jgi:arylsulfatase A-like enzyme
MTLGCSPSTDTSVVRLVDLVEREVIVGSPLLAPELDEELEQLRTAWPGIRDVDGIGVVKRGLLLPTPRVGRTRPPFDSTFAFQDALFAPAPSHLRFELQVPEGGRLTFSYALAEGSAAGDAATFEVRVARRGEIATAFAETIHAAGGLYWRQASVDLERWSRARVELHLMTSSESRGLALWGTPIVDAPRRPSEPPNVLLIGIDTLRADRLSSYGHERPTSPHIDALAAEGIRFDNAISAANWTAPSFASIFTGLPPSRHGVGTDPGRWRPAEYDEATSTLHPLTGDVVTLAERFRQGGWRTEAVAFKPALFGVGLDQGFDRWFNMPTSRRTGQENLDRAMGWLAENHDRRFFMFFHLNDPHQPFNQPADYEHPFGELAARKRLRFNLPVIIARGEVRGCRACAPEGRLAPDFITVARDLYEGEIAYADHLLGSLIAGLREWGIYDDTVIALLSDHGELLYERPRYYGHGGRWMTDDLVRVPLIVKPHAAAGLPRGLVIEDQVRTTDLLPTLLDLAGLGPGAPTADSRTLVGAIRSPGTDSRLAFTENPRKNTISLRTGRWKFVVRPRRPEALYELYDLEADPAELRNVFGRHLDEAARLAEKVVPFFLRSRPGPFLLALGDGSPGELRLLLESSRPETKATHIFGVPPSKASASTHRERATLGRVIAFVELEPGASVSARLLSRGRPVASRTAAPDQMLSYREDVLTSLLELDTPDIYFLHGAPALSSTAAPAPANLDQIEELRALGYID